MVNLCKYKNMFGEVKTGIHSVRFMDIAILDLAATAIVSYIISYVLKINFWLTFFLFILFGIFVHRLFCVRTTIDKYLFPNVK